MRISYPLASMMCCSPYRRMEQVTRVITAGACGRTAMDTFAMLLHVVMANMTLCHHCSRMERVTRAIIAGACGRTAVDLYSDLERLDHLKVGRITTVGMCRSFHIAVLPQPAGTASAKQSQSLGGVSMLKPQRHCLCLVRTALGFAIS